MWYAGRSCQSNGVLLEGLAVKNSAIVVGVCLLMSVGVVSAAPTITDSSLNTANDLIDIGGGTTFYGASDGTKDVSGGGPWKTYAGPTLYDNDTNTYGRCMVNGTYPAPALVGVHNMTEQVELGAFAITTGQPSFSWERGYNFVVQGSNDTTDGFDGTWTTIFSATGTFDGFKTVYYDSIDNTFLTTAKFESFRIGESDGEAAYAEVEFFEAQPPRGFVFTIK